MAAHIVCSRCTQAVRQHQSEVLQKYLGTARENGGLGVVQSLISRDFSVNRQEAGRTKPHAGDLLRVPWENTSSPTPSTVSHRLHSTALQSGTSSTPGCPGSHCQAASRPRVTPLGGLTGFQRGSRHGSSRGAWRVTSCKDGSLSQM